MGDGSFKTIIIIVLIALLVFSYYKPSEGQNTIQKIGDVINNLVSGLFGKVKDYAGNTTTNTTNTTNAG